MSDRAKCYLQLLQEAQANDDNDEFRALENEMHKCLSASEMEEIYVNLI